MTKRMFSTATEAPQCFSLTLGDETLTYEGDNLVKGLKIFKVGRFKDSRGKPGDWTLERLQAACANFELLRSQGVLPNVPVREDHSETVANLAGYFDKVYMDPTNKFMLADVDFTEPDKHAKFKRGTYRSRSVEIGRYEDNDGNLHEPVVLGLAFVDLPAVEGLFRSPSGSGDLSPDSGADPNKEITVATKFKLNGVETEDVAAVAAYITELESFKATSTPLLTRTFKLGGTETSDFEAVQTELTKLETFRDETISGGRAAYVDQLAKDGKIGNPMVEAFKAMVGTMNDEQFTSFKAGYDKAPKLSMFDRHVGGAGGPPADGQPTEVDDLEDIVKQHRMSGKDEAWIENTASFKRLKALKATS